MKLIDPNTGRMECRVCGAVHWANLKTGGGYYRGSWQCHDRDNHPPIDDAVEIIGEVADAGVEK